MDVHDDLNGSLEIQDDASQHTLDGPSENDDPQTETESQSEIPIQDEPDTLVTQRILEGRQTQQPAHFKDFALVQTPAGAHFVVALSKSYLPCLVLVEPRKRWTDDRLGQTVTRLEITLWLMC